MKVLLSSTPGLKLPAHIVRPRPVYVKAKPAPVQQRPARKPYVRILHFKDVRPGTLFAPALYKVTIIDGKRIGYHFRTEKPKPEEIKRLERRGIVLYTERVRSALFVKSASQGGQATGQAAGAEHAGLVIFHPMQECAVAYWGS